MGIGQKSSKVQFLIPRKIQINKIFVSFIRGLLLFHCCFDLWNTLQGSSSASLHLSLAHQTDDNNKYKDMKKQEDERVSIIPAQSVNKFSRNVQNIIEQNKGIDQHFLFGIVSNENQKERKFSASSISTPSSPGSLNKEEKLRKISRACTIYCDGPVLHTFQMAEIFDDSKEFVDMPMKVEPEVILEAFNTLTDKEKKDTLILKEFLQKYFDPAGNELIPYIPPEMSYIINTNWEVAPVYNVLNQITFKQINNNPKLPSGKDNEENKRCVIEKLKYTFSTKYKEWSQDLIKMWANLARRMDYETIENQQEKFSILPRKYPLVIPGGRFRETYYWDSYWIVLGLLSSGMYETAKGLIYNLFGDIQEFGFIPNGGRIYFLNRSQPPLLSEMVISYLEHYLEYLLPKIDHDEDTKIFPSVDAEKRQREKLFSEDLMEFVSISLESLQAEYQYWMNESNLYVVKISKKSKVSDENRPVSPENLYQKKDHNFGHETYILNRYKTRNDIPRPESYREDYTNACTLSETKDQIKFYEEIAAGAETGWDFSSRWLPPQLSSSNSRRNISSSFDIKNEKQFNLSEISTSSIVPVELNTFLYKLEMNLAKLFELKALLDTKSNSIMEFSFTASPTNYFTSETLHSPEERSIRNELQNKSRTFYEAAEKRKKAINELMWDEQDHCWYDLYLYPEEEEEQEQEAQKQEQEERNNKNQSDQNSRFIVLSGRMSISNYFPLWANIVPMEEGLSFKVNTEITESTQSSNTKMEIIQSRKVEIVKSLVDSGLIQNAGIQCTNIHTGEQWDAPNAWPPLEHLMLMTLLKLSSSSSITEEKRYKENKITPPIATNENMLELALSMTDVWLNSNYKGYQESGGYMYEKYDANISGARGEGGEYTPQVGFGWTNGAALHLLLVIGKLLLKLPTN